MQFHNGPALLDVSNRGACSLVRAPPGSGVAARRPAMPRSILARRLGQAVRQKDQRGGRPQPDAGDIAPAGAEIRVQAAGADVPGMALLDRFAGMPERVVAFLGWPPAALSPMHARPQHSVCYPWQGLAKGGGCAGGAANIDIPNGVFRRM